jgi:hypothetical protein
MADLTEPRLPWVLASLALSIKLANLGMAIAARIPIIATTIINSIKVNPLLFL